MTRPLLCGIDCARHARRLDESSVQQVPFPRGRSGHRGCEQLAQRRYAQMGPDRESNFRILYTACACFKVSASAVFCLDIYLAVVFYRTVRVLTLVCLMQL